jgi:ketosteroid isomerase-like protein
MSDSSEVPTTAHVLRHHNIAMGQRDLDAVMSDYDDEAVLIDPAGTFKGKTAIRAAFERLLRSGVPLEPPTREVIEGELAYLVWSAPANKPGRVGAETLLIRHGKIVAQTVAALGPPPPHT